MDSFLYSRYSSIGVLPITTSDQFDLHGKDAIPTNSINTHFSHNNHTTKSHNQTSGSLEVNLAASINDACEDHDRRIQSSIDINNQTNDQSDCVSSSHTENKDKLPELPLLYKDSSKDATCNDSERGPKDDGYAGEGSSTRLSLPQGRFCFTRIENTKS